MKVLVIGGSGLIGSEIVGLLLEEGYVVIGMARGVDRARRRFPEAQWVSRDLGKMTTSEAWHELLNGVDSVVNASGMLQSTPAEDIEAVQNRAMKALFSACEANGNQRIVHISATGADAPANPFTRTKRDADDFLRDTALGWTILRPGVVIGDAAYGGSAMIRAMAAIPWVSPELKEAGTVRVLSTRDVAAAVHRALLGEVPDRRTYDLVGEDRLEFGEVLGAFRNHMGLPNAKRVRMPMWMARIAFGLGDVASLLGWRPAMRSTALTEVIRGVDGDPAPWRKVTGHSMMRLDRILARRPPSVQDLWFARLWLLKPIVLGVLSLFWMASGLVGIVRHEEAMKVLSDSGLPVACITMTVIGGGIVDILIGIGIAFRRTARAALLLSIVVALGYMAGAILLAPWLWLDPLGPMVKVFPAIVLSLVALAILEDR